MQLPIVLEMENSGAQDTNNLSAVGGCTVRESEHESREFALPSKIDEQPSLQSLPVMTS